MKNLEIQKKPFFESKLYDGSYTTDPSLWEDEYQEENYTFTLVIDIDNQENTTSVQEVIWSEKTPRNVDLIEDYIKQNYLEIIEL